MPASHPNPRVAEGHDSSANKAGTNQSRKAHSAPQAPRDLAALASPALSQLRRGHPSKKNRHLVFMSFIREIGWRCSFSNADGTPISRQIVFRCADKVLETARKRGNGIANEIDRFCLQQKLRREKAEFGSNSRKSSTSRFAGDRPRLASQQVVLR